MTALARWATRRECVDRDLSAAVMTTVPLLHSGRQCVWHMLPAGGTLVGTGEAEPKWHERVQPPISITALFGRLSHGCAQLSNEGAPRRKQAENHPPPYL